MEFHNIKIYRLTHISNIPHIMEHGITHRNSEHNNQNFTSIGDESLINHRRNRQVPISNGNNGYGIFPPITLGDYIPFYFGVKMPMLYVIQKGGNHVAEPTHPKKIIYLACNLVDVITLTNNYYYCDGHATDIFTSFFNSSEIERITDILDWDAIRATYWGGEENLNTKRKKQAEFLIAGEIPAELIVGYACYNDWAQTKLIEFGVPEDFITVKPNIYY